MSRLLLDQADWTLLLPRIRANFAGRVPACDIEDLTQDVVQTAFESCDDFDPNKSAYRTLLDQLAGWLSGIARFKLMEYYEKHQRERRFLEKAKEQSDELFSELRLPPDALLESDDWTAAMQSALRDCSPSLLAAAKLFLEGKSSEQIANELGISLQAAYGRLSRFKKMLKGQLHHLHDQDLTIETLYSSELSLRQAILQLLQKETMQGCQWDDPNSLRNYNGQLKRLDNLDAPTRECLLRARSQIEASPLSLDDKRFATHELNSLTLELQQTNCCSETLQFLWKQLKEVAPTIATDLKGIQRLAQALRS